GGDVTGPAGAVDGEFAVYSGTTGKLLGRLASNELFPRGYIVGLKISNNSADAVNDIDIAEGGCRDDSNSANILLSAMTKRLDAAWAAGTNQGGRDTGAIGD